MIPGSERVHAPTPGGVAVRPAESLLALRAAEFLAAGPSAAVPLIEHVCQMPGAPLAVAEHMAAALFAGRDEFARGVDGRWRLAGLGQPPLAPAYSPLGARRVGVPADGPTWRAGYPGVDAAAVREHAGPAFGRGGDAEYRPLPPPQPIAYGPCLASLSYVVVDVETTGGRSGAGDRVTEVAAVVVRDGAIAEVFETLVNPQRPIPPWISRLTNITWEMVRDKPSFREICPDLLRIMRGHVFVAHNAGFDWRFLTNEVERATGERLTGPTLCTVRLARKLLPQLPRRSLDWVARHYNVDIGNRHRAGGDALATAHVLLGLLRDAEYRGCTTWPALQEILGARAQSGRRRKRRRSALPHPVDRDTTA